MKLEKIKLCGFKSFVDQISIPIDGNLIAIVGPNGCGKSNIIDAIRWVMGESSAKHLRGGHMTDVIFNGSATRKPVHSATVELVFDNSEGKVTGEYADSAKFAIKRQMSRNGHSLYFLNGSRCRRKDITDLFLGTGLGARSYAIIEQGTISRIIEAKPDELRTHIEEAAEISRYKERRHETEIRMRDTRENLERLTDLRDEIAKQLKHLKTQADQAEKYTTLKQQQDYQLELLAMRWNQHHLLDKQLDEKLATIANEHKHLLVLQHSQEQNREHKTCTQKQQQQQLDATQKKIYQHNTEIAQLQQLIANNEKNQQEACVEIERLQHAFDQSLDNYQQELKLLNSLEQQWANNQQNLLIAETVNKQDLKKQQHLTEQQSIWQQQWEHYCSEVTKQQQQLQLQQLKMTQFSHQSQQLQIRLKKLHQQRSELSTTQLQADIAHLEQSIFLIEQQGSEQHQQLIVLQQKSEQQKQRLKIIETTQHENQASLHTINGKITALELLQNHAMGKDNEKLTLWLEQRQLINQPRLLEFLKVETGWDTALEIVLGQNLQAFCVDNIDEIITHLQSLDNQALTLFEKKPCLPTKAVLSLPTLLDKVSAAFDLATLLTGIYCATNVNEARGLSQQLAPHESIITREGIWLGHNWLKIFITDNNHQGILQREQQLRLLKQQHHSQQQQIQQQQQTLNELEKVLKHAEIESAAVRHQEKLLTIKASAQTAKLSAYQAKLEQQQRQLEQINTEIGELELNITEESQQFADLQILKQQAEDKLKTFTEQKQSLKTQQQQLQQQLEPLDHALHQTSEQLHSLQSRHQSLTVAKKAAKKHSESLQQQHHQAKLRIEALHTKHNDASIPLESEKTMLVQLTAQQSSLDKTLSTQHQHQQSFEKEMKTLNEMLTKTQQQVVEKKEQLDSLRFEQQETQVRKQTFHEQLKELKTDIDVHSVLKNLTANAELKQWKKSLDEVSHKINRLGSVNLTAVDEFKTQSTRKAVLDEQHDDLISALTTLERAIEKINKETRLRFKATFDKINKGLQEKFPKLFGGGQACLELAEYNSLEAGVNVIARPPGKKNSSIHLLSGGEKALTAVALVFSIFELNPAPFCLLDEVDAPLDDANVGRFSKLLEDMSASVQFLFISHNKVTMEIAEQLTGVTMKEPGVSRMVAVNINEAVKLAES